MHAVLGVLFIATGIAAFAWPDLTFVALANLVAWFLIFRGTFEIIIAFASRGEELWWVRQSHPRDHGARPGVPTERIRADVHAIGRDLILRAKDHVASWPLPEVIRPIT